MEVIRITTLREFDALKTEYEAVYAADPHAQFFLSWTWLRGWFELTPYAWSVLAVRETTSSACVAFLPLMTRGLRVFGIHLIRLLKMGGRPLSWYTGFVCLPEFEVEALPLLASHIDKHMAWDRFDLDFVADSRLNLFLDYFASARFMVQSEDTVPSMQIALPPTWPQYLAECVGATTRRNIRQRERRIERRNDLRREVAQADSVDADIDALLGLWQWRWGPKPFASWERSMLRHCFAHDCLRLTVLWHGATPVSAVACIIDQTHKTMYAYIVGYEARYAELSAGGALFDESIRHAIENGFRVYDFLVGSEGYKFSFGGQPSAVKIAFIKRRGLRSRLAIEVVTVGKTLRTLLINRVGPLKRTKVVKRAWLWSAHWLARLKIRRTLRTDQS